METEREGGREGGRVSIEEMITHRNTKIDNKGETLEDECVGGSLRG